MESPYGGKGFTIVILIMMILLVGGHLIGFNYYSDAPDTVEVPVVLDLSGDRADEGTEYLRGIEIAIDDINAGGRRQFVPVIYDTHGSVETMQECFNDITSKGYTFMLGPMSADEARVVVQSDYDICALTFSVSSTFFSDEDRIFRNTMTDEQYANAIELYLNGGYKSAVILYNKTFESSSMLNSLMLKLDDKKIHISKVLVTDPEKAGEELLKLSPDVVVSILPAASGLEKVIATATGGGLKAKWLGIDSSVSDEVASAIDGFYAVTTQRIISEPSFFDKYEKKYGGSPDPKAMYGYDFMAILGEVVNSDGSSYSRFDDGMKTIRYIGMTGFIKFNEHGDCYSSSNIVVSHDGEWIILSWNDILNL